MLERGMEVFKKLKKTGERKQDENIFTNRSVFLRKLKGIVCGNDEGVTARKEK